jgi:hypothetical protein
MRTTRTSATVSRWSSAPNAKGSCGGPSASDPLARSRALEAVAREKGLENTAAWFARQSAALGEA